MKIFFKANKSTVWIKIHKPFKRQAEGATCQCGEVEMEYTYANFQEHVKCGSSIYFKLVLNYSSVIDSHHTNCFQV